MATYNTTNAPLPWMEPYMQDFMSRAQEVANTPYQQAPGTFVGPNDLLQDSWQMAANRAMQGNAEMSAARGQLTNTIGGQFLGRQATMNGANMMNPYMNAGNPYMDTANANAGIQNQFTNAYNVNAGVGNAAANRMNAYAGVRNEATDARNEAANAFNRYAGQGNTAAGVRNEAADARNANADSFNRFAGQGNAVAGIRNEAANVANPFTGLNNPYLQQSIDNAQGDLARNYNLVNKPAWDKAMQQSGSFGNTGVAEMAANERNNLMQNMGRIGSDMRNQAYNQSASLAESQAGRQFQAGSQLQQNLYGAGQQQAQNLYGAGEGQAGRQFSAGESQVGRQFTAGSQLQQNLYGAGQQQAQNLYGAGESQAGRQFSAGESRVGRQYQSGNQLQQNLYGAGQQQAQNQFSAGNQLQQNLFNAGEAQAGRQFNAGSQLQQNLYNAGNQQAQNRYGTGLQQMQNQFSAGNQYAQNQFSAGQDYAGRQDAMSNYERSQQMAAMGMAPAFANQDWTDMNNLMNIGQQRQGFDQAAQNQLNQQFMDARNFPQQQLAFYGQNLGLNTGGTSTQTAPDPSRASQLVGGAITGAQLYNWFDQRPSPTTSDRRLKTRIKAVGRLDNGLTVYRYRYKAGGPEHIGVMADEVAIIKPEAYIKGGAGGGFDAVDYAKL